MFEPTSRYSSIETATMTAPDGAVIAYKRRRFVPPPESLLSQLEVVVAQGDRLDLIAARTLGDSEQFWRLCDASGAMNPAELTAEPGGVVRVPTPQAFGR